MGKTVNKTMNAGRIGRKIRMKQEKKVKERGKGRQ